MLFANFAEAMAEARGKAQAETLRKTKTDTIAKKLLPNGSIESVPASQLRAGDIVICEAGDIIPGDGDVIEGIATVDESVITGESAPVIRESGGDRSAVTGGTKVLSDRIKIRITSNPGETFLDRMIALVEGAQRQKTPNEIALNILIAGLTLIFLLAVVSLLPFSAYAVSAGQGNDPVSAVLVSLLGLPDSHHHRRIAFGHRHRRHGSSDAAQRAGHEREGGGGGRRRQHSAAGQDRHHHAGQPPGSGIFPVNGVTEGELADAAQLSSLADETPEGRSVVVLAKEKYGLRGREMAAHEAQFIPFSAYTRMSGVDIDGRQSAQGRHRSHRRVRPGERGEFPPSYPEIAERISRKGGTPLAVADGPKMLGVIHLKDIVKGGMKERIGQLRHGNPLRHDYGRQSSHRCRHCR